MRKDSITKRAFKLYSSYNPKYFPVKFFQILFDNFAPYFTLWMSSEIVTALYSKADKQSVYILIAITLLGNLLVRIISAVLKRAVDTQLQILGINECVAFNTKTLSLDYDKLENPEVRQHRRRITENSYINYYGVKHMRMDVEQLMTSAVNIGFSLRSSLKFSTAATSPDIEISDCISSYPIRAFARISSLVVNLL